MRIKAQSPLFRAFALALALSALLIVWRRHEGQRHQRAIEDALAELAQSTLFTGGTIQLYVLLHEEDCLRRAIHPLCRYEVKLGETAQINSLTCPAAYAQDIRTLPDLAGFELEALYRHRPPERTGQPQSERRRSFVLPSVSDFSDCPEQ